VSSLYGQLSTGWSSSAIGSMIRGDKNPGEYGNSESTLHPDASAGLVRSRHGNSVGSVHFQ
jgi:hypothetical protein